MGFEELLGHLVTEINLRVRNGEWTERRLARLTGVSQPHIHNVLKGTRKLTPEIADHLMAVMNVSIAELMSDATAETRRPPAQISRLDARTPVERRAG